jgi:hypothetical protein
MALPYRFPWIWSPAAETIPPPPPPAPPFWTKGIPVALAYNARQAQSLPRFQHIYPEESSIGWTKKEGV